MGLTVVATELDSSSGASSPTFRGFGVPINAVFFSFLEDEGRRYLARSWLAASDDGATGASSTTQGRKSKRADWNQRDWFVSFGEHDAGRSWADGPEVRVCLRRRGPGTPARSGLCRLGRG